MMVLKCLQGKMSSSGQIMCINVFTLYKDGHKPAYANKVYGRRARARESINI